VQHTSLRGFKATDDIHVVIQEAHSALVNLCDEKIYEDIKRLLTTAKNVLWVTRGATVECDNPERAMITGLARTARSEDHSLRLVTLDLDPKENSKSEAAKYINQVLNLVFHQTQSNYSLPDFEFAVRDGVLKIPRIVENPAAEHYVGNSVTKRNETDQPIRQENRDFLLV
jgi:emericellamide synthase (highly reducing iterative type I polyketide synthase)